MIGKHNRTYTSSRSTGKLKQVLLTWSQNKCVICHKYLRKHQKKYCDFHAKEAIRETTRVYDSRRYLK